MKAESITLVSAILCGTTLLLAQPGPGNGPQNGPPPPSQNPVPQITLLPEFRPIGGSGNNLAHPGWDPVPGSPELAIAPLTFAPGPNDNLLAGPNPRLISNVIAGGTGAGGQNGETNDSVTSAWMYVFGQFLDHDISLENTPPGAVSIPILVPDNDPVFGPGTRIAMTRDERSPSTNTITNTVAGYLDLSQLYGSTADMAATLRNPDGTLVSSGSGQYLQVANNAFITGDPRVMENPELSSVTTLFMREHNYWVVRLKAANPGWTGDQLYNMAKAITTAEYQNIIYTEYLPLLIGPVLGPYNGYNSNINVQVTQEFSAAAFRVGHSQVSDTQEGLDNNGAAVFTEPLSQAFQNTAAIDETNGINPLLRSLGSDYSQATDVYTVATLRDLLFAPLPGGDIDEMDLIAIDIQRERDAGLATLNPTRQAIGLPAYRSFTEITSDPILQQNLQAVYGSVNNLDLFIGGLAEDHAPGADVGPTFQAIIAAQFAALRAGDRFFWQNEPFDPRTASMIANTKLADIILRNTDTTSLQPNVFIEAPLGFHTKTQIPPPTPPRRPPLVVTNSAQ
jgi:peroxidase